MKDMHNKCFISQEVSIMTDGRNVMETINDLRAKILQSRKISNSLKGLLCANSYRNQEGKKLAGLKEELRNWHVIRRQATQSRLVQVL